MDDNSPIAPGETKTLEATATDTAWENEPMTDLIYDPDSRFGALARFRDAAGTPHTVEIGGPIIPSSEGNEMALPPAAEVPVHQQPPVRYKVWFGTNRALVIERCINRITLLYV